MSPDFGGRWVSTAILVSITFSITMQVLYAAASWFCKKWKNIKLCVKLRCSPWALRHRTIVNPDAALLAGLEHVLASDPDPRHAVFSNGHALAVTPQHSSSIGVSFQVDDTRVFVVEYCFEKRVFVLSGTNHGYILDLIHALSDGRLAPSDLRRNHRCRPRTQPSRP